MIGRLRRWIRPRHPLSAGEAYEEWAAGYPPHAHNPLMQLEERVFLEMLPDPRGCTVLDLACGSGRYLGILQQRGAARIVGADRSPAMLARARQISPDVVRTDLLDLGLRSGRFHLITCALAVGHVRDLSGVLMEISRVLASRGTVIYSDIHPIGSWLGWERSFQGPDGRTRVVKHHPHSYADHVAACRAAGLKIEDVREPRIEFQHRWRGLPALLIIRAGKPE